MDEMLLRWFPIVAQIAAVAIPIFVILCIREWRFLMTDLAKRESAFLLREKQLQAFGVIPQAIGSTGDQYFPDRGERLASATTNKNYVYV